MGLPRPGQGVLPRDAVRDGCVWRFPVQNCLPQSQGWMCPGSGLQRLEGEVQPLTACRGWGAQHAGVGSQLHRAWICGIQDPWGRILTHPCSRLRAGPGHATVKGRVPPARPRGWEAP